MHTKKEPWLLVGLALALLIIWQLPGGDYFIYPFTILSTWFHEMGHGLMAWALGGTFLRLEIFQNGSGLATYSLPVTASKFTHGLIALAGPIGPADSNRNTSTGSWAQSGLKNETTKKTETVNTRNKE